MDDRGDAVGSAPVAPSFRRDAPKVFAFEVIGNLSSDERPVAPPTLCSLPGIAVEVHLAVGQPVARRGVAVEIVVVDVDVLEAKP